MSGLLKNDQLGDTAAEGADAQGIEIKLADDSHASLDDGSPAGAATPVVAAANPAKQEAQGTKDDLRTVTIPPTLTKRGKSQFCNNFVKTAKYSILTFLPLFFYEQFSIFANQYFLAQSILVCIPQISPYVWYSTAMPFMFILFVAAVQETFSDFLRHRDDDAANGKKATVLKNGSWDREVEWKDVAVGDIMEISDGDQVPADMVILATLETDDADTDKASNCFVDTAALDGETNKKEYVCHQETCHLRNEKALSDFKCTIEAEAPNSKLYQFSGKLTLQGGKPLNLAKEHVLLREMTVSGTNKVWGIVVYTGVDTKIQKNNAKANEAPSKNSKMQTTLNKYIKWIFVFLMFTCAVLAICAGMWFAEYGTDSWYLALSDGYSDSFSTNWFGTNEPVLVGLISFFTFFILLGNMIPISLTVTLESFIKFSSGYWIQWDGHMYYKELNKGALCRNPNIIEETGQIQIVLSDKTGTLTQNKMHFLKGAIHGIGYGKGVTEVQLAQAKLDGTEDEVLKNAVSDEERAKKVADFGQDKGFVFYDERVSGNAWCEKGDKPAAEGVEDYLRAFALCHTVQPRANELDSSKIDYSAESPDDGALVVAAANLGFKLLKRLRKGGGIQEIHLKEPQDDDVPYLVLDLMDANSDRKRMDVIVQSPEDVKNGMVTVVAKGADNYIAKYCCTEAERSKATSIATGVVCQEHADQGLRTMYVAHGKTSLENFYKWQKEMIAVRETNFGDDKLGRLAAFDEVEQKLECGEYMPEGMTLLGSTALEDALQEDVGKTLRMLRQGKIKTWVLTGDKVGTAIEIGTACELLTDFMNQIKIIEKPILEDGTEGPTITAEEILTYLEDGMKNVKVSAEEAHDRKKLFKAAEDEQKKLFQSRSDPGSPDGAGVTLKEFEACGYTEDRFKELDLNNDGLLDFDEIIASKITSALIIEGGALNVLGIGVAEAEARGLRAAEEALKKAKNNGSGVEAAQKAVAVAQEETEKMKDQQIYFIKLAHKCQAVLCCRATPQQKGDITRLVKSQLGQITLGVGDGANDVDMIKAAHIGVGIQGVEGSQAVNSADFALSQFKHLQNILFVHGRWAYRRVARAIVYFFYKNMIPTLTILYYIIVTGFSGTGMYDEMVISGYNLCFTSIPVIVFALMEQDVSCEESLNLPVMYTLGQDSELFNPRVFMLWMGEAVYSSLVCFIVPWYTMNTGCEDGHPRPQGQVAITMFSCVLIVVTARLAVDTQFWTWIHAVTYIASIAIWFLFIAFECSQPAGFVTYGTMYYDFFYLAPDPEFYMIVVLVIVCSLMPAWWYRGYNRNYEPTPSMKICCPVMRGPNVVEKAQLEQRSREEQEKKNKKELKAVRSMQTKVEKRRETISV